LYATKPENVAQRVALKTEPPTFLKQVVQQSDYFYPIICNKKRVIAIPFNYVEVLFWHDKIRN
jgi:hypothetical protein